MKKYILTLFTLATLNLSASTMVIENHTPGAVCIQMMSTNTLNGINYFYIDQDTHCQFTIESMDVFEVTDFTSQNRQFPFLDVYPFSGNVLQGPGLTSQLPLATLPLPFTNDNGDNSPTRFQFEYIKYLIKGRTGGTGFGPSSIGGVFYQEMASYNDTLDLFNPPIPYSADFIRMGSIYYFSFQ